MHLYVHFMYMLCALKCILCALQNSHTKCFKAHTSRSTFYVHNMYFEATTHKSL